MLVLGLTDTLQPSTILPPFVGIRAFDQLAVYYHYEA